MNNDWSTVVAAIPEIAFPFVELRLVRPPLGAAVKLKPLQTGGECVVLLAEAKVAAGCLVGGPPFLWRHGGAAGQEGQRSKGQNMFHKQPFNHDAARPP